MATLRCVLRESSTKGYFCEGKLQKNMSKFFQKGIVSVPFIGTEFRAVRVWPGWVFIKAGNAPGLLRDWIFVRRKAEGIYTFAPLP